MPSSPPLEEASSLYAIGTQLQVISSEINAAAALLGEDDPELQAEGVALLEQYLAIEESTKGALAAKADRLLGFTDHLIAQSAFRRQQADRLAALAKQDQAKVERLHAYLIKVLTTLDPDKTSFSFETHELTSRKNTEVLVDEALIPEQDLEPQFVRTKTTYSPDKAAIKAALKAGQSVAGCSLLEKRNWTVK